MAGIYIHIPFCLSICGYCDYFKSTALNKRSIFFKVLCDEILYRVKEFPYEISTIYFGGGTPSLMSLKDLDIILKLIKDNYLLSSDIEITIESNPDDLTKEYLEGLLMLGFNRISIGVQSLLDDDLIRMKRRHNSVQAVNSVLYALESGFKNISVDYIYGLPWSNSNLFKDSLDLLYSLPFHHLSAYHLIIEKSTYFWQLQLKNKISPIKEEESLEQYEIICNSAASRGLEHYELSSFCIPGYRSKHNSSYWLGKFYIGFGPGAHSFYANKRRWNKAELGLYCRGDLDKIFESENLTLNNLYNEKIMLGLRIKEGINLEEFRVLFPQFYSDFIFKAQKWLNKGVLKSEDNFLKCTESAWYILDSITADFFLV